MRRSALAATALGVALSAGALELDARRREACVERLPDARLYRTWPGAHGANADGLHERASADLPPGRRLLVLGDSMTWGTGTAAQAWPRVAEAARAAAGAPPWTFVNASTYGYDTTQEAAALDALTGYRADAVLLAAFWNDLVPTRVIDAGSPPLPMWVAADAPPTAGLRLLRGVAETTLHPGRLEAPDRAVFRAAVRHIIAAAAGRPVRALVLWPQALAGDGAACPSWSGDAARCAQAAAWSAELSGLLAAEGLPVLDARAALDAPDANAPDWQHPGPDGQARIGAWVAAHLTVP